MLRALIRLALVTPLLVSAAPASADLCVVGIDCVKCNFAGRAYIRVGVWCVVCMQFCLPQLASGSDNTFTEAQRSALASAPVDPAERVLFIKTPAAIIRSVAAENPEAAELLVVMNQRSLSSPNQMPSSGHGAANKLVSYEGVIHTLKEELTDQSISPFLREIPEGDGSYSRVTWSLVKEPDGRGTILLTQRIMNKADEELRAPYPDIDLAVRWIAKHGAGYWQAVSWTQH